MGWASAGSIFDPIAQALIELNATDEMKRRVLGRLIDVLSDGDWDTQDESMDAFRDDPTIIALFMQHGHRNEIDWRTEAQVAWDNGRWLANCRDCRISLGEATGHEGHDQLVRDVVAHVRDVHGGDGKVPDWALILSGGA